MKDTGARTWMAETRHRALAAIGIMVFMAAIYLMFAVGRNDGRPDAAPPAPGAVSKALSRGAVAGFLVKSQRPAVPEIAFQDDTGQTHSLAEWRGRVVLLNLWATWCGPCRKEMPELARLQSQLGSSEFEVVALSLDRGGADKAAPFLKEIGATALKLYVEPAGKTLHQVSAIGLPATILIDRQGREIGRLLGPARWASPEAVALITTAIQEAG